MSLDRGKRPGAEAAHGALEFRSETSQEIAGEQHSVADPFAQRRNLHADLVNPIEEILAKPAFVDQLRQVLVRGADHPDIDLDRPAPANPLDNLVLQETQQLDLHWLRHVANFVEEQRSPGSRI